MLACEEAAAKMSRRTELQQAMLPVIDLDHLKEFIRDIRLNIDKGQALRDIDFAGLDTLNKQMSTPALFSLFTAMQASGILRDNAVTDETMDTEAFREKMRQDAAAGIIKPWGGIGQLT